MATEKKAKTNVKTNEAAPAAATAPVDKTAQLAAARAAREATASKDVFVYVAEPSKRIAPQAQTIVNAIKTHGEKGVTRADLVAGLKGVLPTRQPEGRIVSYYQKLMQEVGAIRIVSGRPASTTAEAPAEATPPAEA